jgi:O-antigen ligase
MITEKESTQTNGINEYSENNEGKYAYYGLILYTIMFYSQIASRFPFLAPLRPELLVGSILVIYAIYRIFTGKTNFSENSLTFWAFFFIIFALITIPFAFVRTRALDTFIRLIKFFAIYLMIITAIDDEKKLKGFFYVYLGMITLLFFEPFLLSLRGEGFIWNNGMWRLAGVTHYFGHPNQLGGITAANLPFFFYLIVHSKSKKIKIICVILLIAAFRVIMLTQSRTAFVGVLTFGFFVWVFSNKKILSIIIAFIASLIIWQFTPQETKDRFLTLANAESVVSGEMGHEEAGSMYSRWVLIQRGFEAFSENPIIGLGLNCYVSFNGRRYNYWFPPHNTFIQVLSEMGLIGTFIFMIVLIITYKNLILSKKIISGLDPDDTKFIKSLISALMVYIMVRMMVSMFGQDLYANYWWLAGGLSVAVLRISMQKSYSQDKKLKLNTQENLIP